MKFNNTDLTILKYNNTAVAKIIYNGVNVGLYTYYEYLITSGTNENYDENIYYSDIWCNDSGCTKTHFAHSYDLTSQSYVYNLINRSTKINLKYNGDYKIYYFINSSKTLDNNQFRYYTVDAMQYSSIIMKTNKGTYTFRADSTTIFRSSNIYQNSYIDFYCNDWRIRYSTNGNASSGGRIMYNGLYNGNSSDRFFYNSNTNTEDPRDYYCYYFSSGNVITICEYTL